MTGIDNSNISQWIDRFLSGETSLKEEKELYAFFNRCDLSPEAEKYREMFSWYASLSSSHTEKEEDLITQPETLMSRHDERNKVRVLHLRSWQWISVAAMVALLLSLGFIFHSPEDIPDDYLSYQGSYIIRDGKKITDLRMVVPEIIRTQKMVDDRLLSLDNSLMEADNAFNRAVAESYDMSDPAVKEIVEATLSY